VTRQALKNKANYTDAEVARVFANIRDHVTAAEVEQAVDTAVREVHTMIGRTRLDRAVYGWSGGKDSIALQVVMEAAGIQRAILGTISGLEFDAYLRWCEQHAPEGLHVYDNTDLDCRWLTQPGHRKYLFPKTSRLGYFWTMAGTRRAQNLYQAQYQPVIQVYGRRWADGNQIGADGRSYARATGILSYSPIRSWSHELVLAVISYYNRPLPPVYRWPHGWTAGTGSWPGRRVGTDDQAWAETWLIEADRVREAADAGLTPAAEWMERNGHAR
jgi:3'-phosphoadenosine 5'-phosphosulfate sulfotransferase (PAPS reductase)/FAD synthetase